MVIYYSYPKKLRLDLRRNILEIFSWKSQIFKGRVKGKRRYRVGQYGMIHERKINKLEFIKIKNFCSGK